MLGVKEVFGDDLAANQRLRAVLASHLASLYAKGALATVRDISGVD
jgi:hypothetical protein